MIDENLEVFCIILCFLHTDKCPQQENKEVFSPFFNKKTENFRQFAGIYKYVKRLYIFRLLW